MVVATGELTLGHVFRPLPRVLGQESIFLCLMFSLFSGALNLLSFVFEYGLGTGGFARNLIAAILSIVMSVAACFIHYAAIHAADMRLNGIPVPAIEALQVGFGRFWDYLALALLLGFVTVVGLLLLVIPGLFAWIAFSLALPALAIRRLDISESMYISWVATGGRRWRIFGIWLVYAIASFIAFATIGLLFAAIFHLLGLGLMRGQVLMLAVLNPVFAGVCLVVSGAVSAIVFHLIETETALV